MFSTVILLMSAVAKCLEKWSDVPLIQSSSEWGGEGGSALGNSIISYAQLDCKLLENEDQISLNTW